MWVYCMHHMFTHMHASYVHILTHIHAHTIHSPEDYGDRSVDEGEGDWDLQGGQVEEENSHSMHLCRTKPRMLRCELINVHVFVCVVVEEEEYSHSILRCRTEPRMLKCDLMYVYVFMCVCVCVCVWWCGVLFVHTCAPFPDEPRVLRFVHTGYIHLLRATEYLLTYIPPHIGSLSLSFSLSHSLSTYVYVHTYMHTYQLSLTLSLSLSLSAYIHTYLLYILPHISIHAYESEPRNRVFNWRPHVYLYIYKCIHIYTHIHIYTYIYTHIHTYRSSAGARERAGDSVMAKEEEWYNSWYEPDGDGTLADDTLAASMLLGSRSICYCVCGGGGGGIQSLDAPR